MHAIAIHGGAGAVPRASLSAQREQRFRAGLEAALDGGYAVLERGGSSLDAVATAVRILEDDPCYNAGHGAALTRDGAVELDAAIMDGKQMRAGAVASLRHVKNPVDLARHVMTRSALGRGDGVEDLVGNVVVGIDGLHVVLFLERLDQSQDRGGVLAFHADRGLGDHGGLRLDDGNPLDLQSLAHRLHFIRRGGDLENFFHRAHVGGAGFEGLLEHLVLLGLLGVHLDHAAAVEHPGDAAGGAHGA